MAKNNILQGENYIGIDYKYTINKTTGNKTFSLKSYLITNGFISELNKNYSDKIIEKIVVKYGVTSGYKGTWNTHILITINGKNYTSATSTGYVVNGGYKTLTQTIYNKDSNGTIQSDYGITIGEALNDASPFNPRIVIDQKGYGTLHWDNTTGARHAEFIIYYKEPSSGEDPGEEPSDPTPIQEDEDIIKNDDIMVDSRVIRYDRSNNTNEYFPSNMGSFLRFPIKISCAEESENSYVITDININFYQITLSVDGKKQVTQYISKYHRPEKQNETEWRILDSISDIIIDLPTSTTTLELLENEGTVESNTVVILPDGTEIEEEKQGSTLGGTIDEESGYYNFIDDELGVPNYYQIEVYGYNTPNENLISSLLYSTDLQGIENAQPQFSIEPGGVGIGILAESTSELREFTIAKDYFTIFQGNVKVDGDLIAKSIFYLPSDSLYEFDTENKIFIEDAQGKFDDYMVLNGNGRMVVNGFVSNDTKSVYFNITTNKSMKYVDEVIIKELQLTLRKPAGGYIIGSSSGSVSVINVENNPYTVTAEIASDYMLTINITKSTDYNTVNNVPVAGMINYLALGFTCFGE